MKYYGSTELSFKKRYSQHKHSIKKRPDNHTTLSSYIWNLKDKGTPFEIKWSIKARGHAFSSGGRSYGKAGYIDRRPKYHVEQKKRIVRNM